MIIYYIPSPDGDIAKAIAKSIDGGKVICPPCYESIDAAKKQSMGRYPVWRVDGEKVTRCMGIGDGVAVAVLFGAIWLVGLASTWEVLT